MYGGLFNSELCHETLGFQHIYIGISSESFASELKDAFSTEHDHDAQPQLVRSLVAVAD